MSLLVVAVPAFALAIYVFRRQQRSIELAKNMKRSSSSNKSKQVSKYRLDKIRLASQ